jgi:hypothetical protein
MNNISYGDLLPGDMLQFPSSFATVISIEPRGGDDDPTLKLVIMTCKGIQTTEFHHGKEMIRAHCDLYRDGKQITEGKEYV